MSDQIDKARRQFAEGLRVTAQVQSAAVVDAFATVPRERFLRPGPWRLLSAGRKSSDYWTTEDADPKHLYHDVLVAIDESRCLNNGQPSLWANLYDQVGVAPGHHVVHIGAGAGYYSAILAEIVGLSGTVTAVEIDEKLAAKARRNLASSWPQATLVTADGFFYQPDQPADIIIVNAGVSHLSLAWLDSLAEENGRLLVPLTTADGSGAFLVITRQAGPKTHYPAKFVSRTGIIDCVEGRDSKAEERLRAALKVSFFDTVRSLRRSPELPDDTCWLAGDEWWLSTAPEFKCDAEQAPASA